MKKRNILNSPRLLALKRKRRKNLRNKILFLIFFFLILFIGLIFLFRIDRLNIDTVMIDGNKVTDTKLINKIVENNLEGYYLYFLPKSNFLLFPKNKIKSDLEEEFKRLTNISFVLKNYKTLFISLLEKEGQYIWCGDSLPDADTKTEDNLCYFIDKNGYVFDIAPYFSGNVYFRFFGSLNSGQISSPLGFYFSSEIFNKLISFKDVLIDMGIKPISILVKDDKDVEIYLASNTPLLNAPKIILNSDFDLEKISENLQAALITEPLKSDFKNKYNSLLYIDLRFGNKVYFKFK